MRFEARTQSTSSGRGRSGKYAGRVQGSYGVFDTQLGHWHSAKRYRYMEQAQEAAQKLNSKSNPLKRGKWISGKVLITRSGQVKFKKGR